MRFQRLFWTCLVLFLIADAIFIAFILWSRREQVDVLGRAPAFALTNQRGGEFTNAALDGKVWIAKFFFTSCAGPCPRLTEKMHELQEVFRAEPDVHFVSISVDPDVDTPERLAQYAKQFGADPVRWHFLTGPIDEIRSVSAEGFKVGSVDEPVLHSTRLILVDRAGQIRGYYSGLSDDDLASLRGAVRVVLQENHS